MKMTDLERARAQVLVEQETATLRRQLAEMRVHRDRWRAIAENEAWPYEWIIASQLKRERNALRRQLAELRQALEFGPGSMDGPAFLEYIACKLEGSKPFNLVLAAKDLRLKAKQARAALDRVGGGEEVAE